MGKRVMIALGGNAIKQPEESGTLEEQMRNVATACGQIAEIARRGYDIVITHGNGPQVGNLAIQQENAQDIVPPQPLVVLGAMTQGQIGYMMQQNLRNLLSDDGWEVVTAVTQVLVDSNDPDFADPHKPVGPFYAEEEAERLRSEKGWTIVKVRPNSDRQWRRVVPSPIPLGIIEGRAIRKMVDSGMIVIASGGGGIPVISNEDGKLEGVDAVIDKDRAGEVLAEDVGANVLLILTDVDSAKLDYGKPDERPIERMTISEARRFSDEGHFLPGSMGPKVEACIKFVEQGGERAIITSLEMAADAMEGRAGTTVVSG
ncbi:MAG: carbamate kinase [Candidatus Bathyarchaeota archaeon]|nr:MAG: carbamate kinase [Candidatus Bathyarchaeota archaeon]